MYKVLNSKENEVIDTATEALIDLSGRDPINYNKPFAANYYIKNKAVSLVNITYYPYMEFNQQDVYTSTPEEIKDFDDYLREEYEAVYQLQGSSIEEWHGTTLIDLNGLLVFRTSFLRDGVGKGKPSVVTFIRVFDDAESFTVTLNYQKDLEYFLKPITEKIISSITKH